MSCVCLYHVIRCPHAVFLPEFEKNTTIATKCLEQNKTVSNNINIRM